MVDSSSAPFSLPVGIGLTAVYMCLTRRRESRRPDALFDDPFAAAAVDALVSPADRDRLAREHGVTPAGYDDLLDSAEFRYFPVRTRFFDDGITTALGAGIRQVVSLGAGLDGRTLRLAAPPDVRWYELDLPEMVDLKDRLVDRLGIEPTVTRQGIGVDLTADWGRSLRAGGFVAEQPTVWLVEGLVMYLSDEAADRLVAELTELSAPGSHLLLEHAQTRMLADRSGTVQRAIRAADSTLRGARDDVEPWLGGHGWKAEVYAGSDPRIGHGRRVPELPAGWLAHGRLGRGSSPPVG